MTDLLSLERVTGGYQGKIAIENVALTAQPGSLTALLGANGAGKSTLMKCIGGLMAPFSGSIRFDGQEIAGKDARRLVQLGISYVPEGRAMARALSVRENLQLGGLIRDRGTRRRQLDMVLTLFPEIAERLMTPAWQLSGGQQQMLAIGRALMSDPRLLLLDEPSLGLAPLLVKRVFERLEQLRRAGLTILLVEQNYWITTRIADYAWFIRNGRIVGGKGAAEMRAAGNLDDILATYLGTAAEMEHAS